MIEDTNVHQCQCVLEPSGQRLVGMTRLGDTRGVVVKKDDGGRVDLQRPLNDDARVNRCAVDGALEQFHRLDDAVAVVQEEAAEHLCLAFGEFEAEIGPGVVRTAQRPTGTMALLQNRQRQADQGLLLRWVERRGLQIDKAILVLGTVGCIPM